jgi:hypothetical protein
MDFIDIRIGVHQAGKFLFGNKMHFGILYLLLQTTHNRRCKNNIANGAKTYYQKFDLHFLQSI